MKKVIFGVIAIALVCISCGEPEFEERTFPRKQLIEQFTSEYCGYCPDAMYCLDDFKANADDQYIVIAHHAGFKNDAYTVDGSGKIATKLGVTGNPSMSINRDRIMVYGYGAVQRTFDPRALPQGIDEPLNTADVSVAIAVDYDAAAKSVKVKVTGEIGKEDITSLRVNVVIKESGMVGPQKDYTNTWEGWEQFTHNNTIRAFLTDPIGDVVEVQNWKYEAEYTANLGKDWDAEKCAVVAFVTKDDVTARPVYNAEVAPVVAGTTGGEDIKAVGVKLVEIPDYYPENNAPKAGVEFENMIIKENVMVLVDNEAFMNSNYAVLPMAYLVFNISGDTIPYGTYEVNNSGAVGTVSAGVRNDDERRLDGSVLLYAIQSEWQQNHRISYNSAWFIASGTVTVSADGVTIAATSKNGSTMNYTYKASGKAAQVAPMKKIERFF